MNRVLVTGVGGGVGQSIIKSLHGSDYEVVGSDCDELAAGLHAVGTAYRIPPVDDPAYVDRLIEICQEEDCRLCFPGLDLELALLAGRREQFLSAGIQLVVSDPDVIAVCDDKLATAAFLHSNGFPSPMTVPYTDDVDPTWFPFVLKPQRGGSRSAGVFVVTDRRQLDAVHPWIDPENCVIQEYLEGDEYTCGIVNLGGSCFGPIAMRRILRAGDTYRAFVIRDEAIEDHVRSLARALRGYGACNVQLRLRGGVPVVFEINARCSGTTAARALAGFNEPKMIADNLLLGLEPQYEIREISVVRYWNELVLQPDRLSDLAAGIRVSGKFRPL